MGGNTMFGLADPWIAAAYLLVILSAILCFVYGIINWNRGGEEDDLEAREWISEEVRIDKNL
jgi:hypothetical protein